MPRQSSSGWKSLRERRARGVEAVLQQGRLGVAGAPGRRGHAAEGEPRVLDLAVLDPQAIGAGHGRDVLVAPLADLVAMEALALPQARQGQALDHFVGRQRRLAVVEEELLERHLARAADGDELQPRLQRQQHRRHVADRRGVADIAADRAQGADLPRAQPREIGTQRREGLDQQRHGPRVGHGGAEGDLLLAGVDDVQLGHVRHMDHGLRAACASGWPAGRDRCRRPAAAPRDARRAAPVSSASERGAKKTPSKAADVGARRRRRRSARRRCPRSSSSPRRSADSRCSGRDCRPAHRGWSRARPARRRDA